MTQPLALVCYERILPGSQLVNQLQDSGYRVEVVMDADDLPESARDQKPMLIFVDLASTTRDVPGVLNRILKAPDTQHLPIVAFFPEGSDDIETRARASGATLVVHESAVLTHLEQLLEQALQV